MEVAHTPGVHHPNLPVKTAWHGTATRLPWASGSRARVPAAGGDPFPDPRCQGPEPPLTCRLKRIEVPTQQGHGASLLPRQPLKRLSDVWGVLWGQGRGPPSPPRPEWHGNQKKSLGETPAPPAEL